MKRAPALDPILGAPKQREADAPLFAACDTKLPQVEKKRLSAQCLRLLNRLKRGEVTNWEIASDLRILNGTARISDLRANGFPVTATHKDGGTWVYKLG